MCSACVCCGHYLIEGDRCRVWILAVKHSELGVLSEKDRRNYLD